MVSDIVITPCSQLCPLFLFSLSLSLLLHAIVFPPPPQSIRDTTLALTGWEKHNIAYSSYGKRSLNVSSEEQTNLWIFSTGIKSLQSRNNYIYLYESTGVFLNSRYFLLVLERNQLQVCETDVTFLLIRSILAPCCWCKKILSVWWRASRGAFLLQMTSCLLLIRQCLKMWTRCYASAISINTQGQMKLNRAAYRLAFYSLPGEQKACT